MNKAVVVGVGVVLFAAAASAQIHKCVDSKGTTTFSQTTCAAGETSKVIDARSSRPSAPAPGLAPPVSQIMSMPAQSGVATPQQPVSTAAGLSRCRPLPRVELVARRRDLQTALSSRTNSPEREEALRLEEKFLELEEQYDMLPPNLAAKRADENTRVTSLVDSTRQDAIRALRQIYRLRWDWDEIPDFKQPGAVKLACRSRTSGEFGPDQNCECKPRVTGAW